MNEGLEQFLATIIEHCLDEHDMRPPLFVCTVGDDGSVLVADINEGAELVVLTKHCENDTFTLPIKVTIVSQNNKTARLVIKRDGNIGRFSLIIEVGRHFRTRHWAAGVAHTAE